LSLGEIKWARGITRPSGPEIVAPHLSRLFGKEGLLEEIKEQIYAFPRGRLEKKGRIYAIYHGDDFQGMVARQEVERLFGVCGKSSWKWDEHERCLYEDKEALREIFQITQDWPSV